jgi:putative inorganic carbon (hco3(-)) transporter
MYLLTEKDWRLRAVALCTTPFIINTLILCNSRGAMVGVAVAVVAAFFLVGSGRRLRMIGAGVATLAIGFYLADPQFIARQQTTTEATDNSSQERLTTWKGGARLVKDRPFGSGGRGFHALSPIYIPDVVEAHGGDPRAPHNTYVMVASEWGVLGLICYLGLYASTFRMLGQIKKRARDATDRFHYWRAFALQLSLIAYMACSMFTDRLYGEAGYWMIGLAYALYRIQATEQASEATATAPSAAPQMAGVGRINLPMPRPV